MNREDALALLDSAQSYERFKAAHVLVKLALARDISVLQNALRGEKDSFVRKRLEAAIANCSSAARAIIEEASETSEDNEDAESEILKTAKAQAIDWVSGLLLHEISSKLGLLSVSAKKDLIDYEASNTKRHIQSLQAIIDSVGMLRNAVNLHQQEQFDLAELITECVEEENDKGNAFDMYGMKPMLIKSSRPLIKLALCNGVRNAIESHKVVVETMLSKKPDSITVTWGVTDKDYWIAVLDDGAGLNTAPKNMFEIGKSSKKGHTGFGLAIARQAIETLNGTLTLQQSNGRGAKYEMRWRIK